MDERGAWDQLPDLYIRLEKDELGYPPKEWEQVKGEQLPDGTAYQVRSVPFYARGLAYGDEVQVTTSEEGFFPVVDSVARRSGYSTMRLWIKEGEDREELIGYFTGKGCLLEFNGPLVALGIPRDSFNEVSDFICDQKEAGRWDAEDGFLIVDENAQITEQI